MKRRCKQPYWNAHFRSESRRCWFLENGGIENYLNSCRFLLSFTAGSTWTQEIVWQILRDGKIDRRRLDERVPFVEEIILDVKSYHSSVMDAKSAEKVFTSFSEPRVFKTHIPYCLVPKGSDEANKPRYIYVMRNPKDVFVSLYHHSCNMPYVAEIPTWDEAFQSFLQGDRKYSPFFAEHEIGLMFVAKDVA